MTEKDIGSLITERLTIKQEKQVLREKYLARRAELIKKISEEYHQDLQKLNRRDKELEKIIAANSNDLFMTVLTGQPKYLVSDDNYGWQYKTADQLSKE